MDKKETRKKDEVVLFLRIESVEEKKRKISETYLLRLEVKSEIKPKEKEVLIEVSARLMKKLDDFGNYRRRPVAPYLISSSESLSQQLEWESALGTEIYQTFFPDYFRKTFEDFFTLLHHRKIKKLHLIISSPVPHILDIPFEMMRKQRGSEPFVIMSNDFHLCHTVERNLQDFRLGGGYPMAPPLRLLFVSALPVDLPEDQQLLELEKEQERIIEAVGDLISKKRVVVEFLDIATLEEIEQSLKAGEHHVVHFSGHGQYPDLSKQKTGVLYLEDELGRTKPVTAAQLAHLLKRYNSVRLVVLSACETAHSEDYGAAGALIQQGIPAVLGMRYPVSDGAAIRFNSQFYEDICMGKPLSHAIFNARKAIYDFELKKHKTKQTNASKTQVVSEWMTPFLYQNQDTCQLLDHSKESTDTHYFFQKPVSLIQGGKYVGRGFVGRRQELLSLYRMFREGKHSVCIYGQGGTGKTTLAIRFADNFENGAYKIIQFRNEISEETILNRLAKEASRYLGEEVIEFIQSPEYEPIDKLNVLIEQFLSRQKIILLFDDFEENQLKSKENKIYQREINSPSLKSFLVHLCKKLEGSSYIIFTTRYLFPEPQLTSLNLGEMGFPDTFKLLTRFENMAQLPTDQKRLVHDMLGGHPHALGLLNHCFNIRDISWERLLRKFQDEKDKEINHDLLLEMLWNQLTGDEQTALMGASVFRDLTSPKGLMAVTGQPGNIVNQVIKSLNAFSLLYMEGVRFYAHRLTASFVQKNKMERKQVLDYHRKAAKYFEGIEYSEGKKHINDGIEARWHFLRAGEWNRAAEITFGLTDYLTLQGYTQLSFELLSEIGKKNISKKNLAILHHQSGILHQHFGNYDSALILHQKSLKLYDNFGDIKNTASCLGEMGKTFLAKGDYKKALEHFTKVKEISENVGDLNSLSNSLHYIGMIYQDKSDYDAALTQYQKALEISEKSGDIKGISSSLGEIGKIYQVKGDYEKALEHFEKVKEMSEKINDVKTISRTLHHIGMIYQDKGDYDNALTQYQKSLEIDEKINDIKGISEDLHNIGTIYQFKGDYDTALTHYQKSLEIAEKIGDIKGVSDSLHQIGSIYQNRGEYHLALSQYQRSLKIKEKINDIKGVSDSLHQVGNIYYLKADYDAALIQYHKSLKIKEKISDIKGISLNLHQIGVIYHAKSNYDAALTHYQKSKKIKERIGDIKGVSASLHQIGMIYHSKGHYKTALKHYQKSVEIKEKIGDIKGLSTSLHQVGMIYQSKKNYDAALFQFQKSLKIKEEIGDIIGTARCYHQIGKLYSEKEDYQTALNYLIRAYLVLSKTNLTKVQFVKKSILNVREQIPEKHFKEILKQFNIPADTFGGREERQ